jgi:hypothetical protein
LDDLAGRKKAEELTEAEAAELAGILELDRIFTLLNARSKKSIFMDQYILLFTQL